MESTPQHCKGDSTETRTIFTMQWLYEDGATPFLRAAQSGDVTVMKLLLAHGADPKIATANGDTALMVAAGIGWVEGVTFEWSEADNLEAVKMCLDLGIDPNIADGDGRTALHGAAHKGRNDVVRLLVDHGAKLDARDKGSRDTFIGAIARTYLEPIDYSRGLVRVGVQSAISHPDTEALLKKLMEARGIPVPSAYRRFHLHHGCLQGQRRAINNQLPRSEIADGRCWRAIGLRARQFTRIDPLYHGTGAKCMHFAPGAGGAVRPRREVRARSEPAALNDRGHLTPPFPGDTLFACMQ